MRAPLKVYLSFDVEIWCNGWEDLDGRFPAAFERYVYGDSREHGYALPGTLEILNRHGLKGVFFVEPLFAARFGVAHLKTIVDLLGGHDVELHLHPEWADELTPLPFPGAQVKRQHLSYYTREEQEILIRLGLDLLAQAGAGRVNAFRTGSFACNRDTLAALAACGIPCDSSLNEIHPDSGKDLRGQLDFTRPQQIGPITELPMTVFRDGTGRLRPAQVGSCSFAEMRTALEDAHRSGAQHFMVLSHNFEMLRQQRPTPDRVVVRRFEALCAYLAAHPERYQVETLDRTPTLAPDAAACPLPQAPLGATLWRHAEQLWRRVAG